MLSIIRKPYLRRATALFLVLLLCLSPLATIAETYDIANGSITITAEKDGETNKQTVNQGGNPKEDAAPVITGSSADGYYTHTVTIEVKDNAAASVTLKDLTIDTRVDLADPHTGGDAALTVTGKGTVHIELEGANSLTSGYDHAGLEKKSEGELVIRDADNDGSLTANGGYNGAGIGGGYFGAVTGITNTGGTVTANGGDGAAGIGGGQNGDGTDITISGGTVTASGGGNGAGIGGGATSSSGERGKGGNIQITGGTVVAAGGRSGPGIGSGFGVDGTGDITVSGDADVGVAGGARFLNLGDTSGTGAGIGTGGKQINEPNSTDPTINGVEATDKLHTDALTSEGSIAYYPAGTTAEQIQKGQVEPTKIVRGGASKKENKRKDSFTAFCQKLAKEILAAPANGTVKMDAASFVGLQRVVLEALDQRPDVALQVTCLLNGQATELTIPAGTDLLGALGKAAVLTFEQIAKLVG